MRVAWLVVLVLTGLTGCSQVLGLEKAELDDGAGRDAAVPDASLIDGPPAGCVPANCPFGCDPTTSACRAGKLWLFATIGATVASGFGGADLPPNVRGGADARCLATYTDLHTARACKASNVHAVLYVSGADTIAGMASRYQIDTTVPVHRATDDVLVANNWNAMLDPSLALRAPATDAPTQDDGIVWTGANGTNHCNNWTATDSTTQGVRGYTTLTDVTWLNRDAFRCDRTARLLCVCWAGPE